MSDSFKAITWNVFHGTGTSKLEPVLKAQLKRGVSLLLMQEAGGADVAGMLRDNGLRTFLAPNQYRVAWDPSHWVGVAEEKVRLSDTPYDRKGTAEPGYSEAAKVILSDKVGRTLTAVSYHTPAHIQHPADERPAGSYRAFVESMRKLGHMAEDAETRGFLAGGDDNWDENTGVQTGDTGPVFLGGGTGLRQVQAPSGTLGKRQVDDFRIRRGGGLRVSGDGWVTGGGGDHRIHGREFRWR